MSRPTTIPTVILIRGVSTPTHRSECSKWEVQGLRIVDEMVFDPCMHTRRNQGVTGHAGAPAKRWGVCLKSETFLPKSLMNIATVVKRTLSGIRSEILRNRITLWWHTAERKRMTEWTQVMVIVSGE